MHRNSFLKRLKPISFGAAMADMALLLLVFFMASTSTDPPKGVEVDLPKARTEGAEQDSVYVTISHKGELYYDGNPVTLQQLHDHLAMRQSESDRIISITAEKSLNYEVVAQVLNVLQEQNFLNVVFMSEPHDKENESNVKENN